jgi:hypothetical protein
LKRVYDAFVFKNKEDSTKKCVFKWFPWVNDVMDTMKNVKHYKSFIKLIHWSENANLNFYTKVTD